MVEFFIDIDNQAPLSIEEFKKAFTQLKNGRHLVTIKDMRKRSSPQNRYYWGVIIPLVRSGLYESGYDDVKTNEDAHEVLKHVILRRRMVSKQTGDVIDIAGSSAMLSVPEFDNYIESICKWAAEYLSIVIPSPNEQYVEFQEWGELITESGNELL